MELILWCSVVENHWALCSGCPFISWQFSWTLCKCFYGIRLHAVHAAGQADRKEAEVSTTWLYLSEKNFAPSKQEVWLSREPSSEKDETEGETDEICMNTAAIWAPTTLLKSGLRGTFWEGIGRCDCCKVAQFNQSLISYLTVWHGRSGCDCLCLLVFVIHLDCLVIMKFNVCSGLNQQLTVEYLLEHLMFLTQKRNFWSTFLNMQKH